MSLFEVPPSGPTADSLSKSFLTEANMRFENELAQAEDLIQRFWYRNKDAQGNGLLEGDEPTGLEILQAMGTNAEVVMQIAHARVQMLVTIATLLGKPELVDLTKVAAPYDIVYAADGSVESWTPKS